MKKHSKSGTPVKIVSGPFKDRYFTVIDYLRNQFQGKAMEKLEKSQNDLLAPLKRRGMPMDDDVVFGKLYHKDSMASELCCMHDSELQVKPNLKLITEETLNDERPTNTGNNHPISTGGPEEPEGRSVPSAEKIVPIARASRGKKRTDSDTGSPAGSTES